MHSLQTHHITDVYCLIDDLLPVQPKPKGGRPLVLKSSEVVTILLWNTLTAKQRTLKDIYEWLRLSQRGNFPALPTYGAFVQQCHRVLPELLFVLESLLQRHQPLRLMDSTMLPVCKNIRAAEHKVCRNIADFGKNHQGWFYGFKLHASIDSQGRLCGLTFTPASHHDAQSMPKILNRHTKIAVGDTLYGARVMRERIFEHYGTIILAPPHPKQRRKLMTQWQHFLLKARRKIECVFDYLKEHLGLVSSFPRSVRGYLLHYVRILAGYQFLVTLA